MDTRNGLARISRLVSIRKAANVASYSEATEKRLHARGWAHDAARCRRCTEAERLEVLLARGRRQRAASTRWV